MKDEPWITLPTVPLITTTLGTCALAAALWAGVGALLGYEGQVLIGGAVAAGLMGASATIVLLLSMPWVSKPVSTTMVIWLGVDLLSAAFSLGGAYLLYSATLLDLRPLLLGVVLAFFLVLLGKAAVVASHMRKHFP